MVTKTIVVQGPPRRLDLLLAEAFPEHSRSYLQKLIKEGRVTVGKCRINRPAYKVKGGNQITVDFPPPPPNRLTPTPLSLKVLYEDADLMILAKPPGLSVHPGAGFQRATLVQALIALDIPLSTYGGVDRPGLVHRLDKETSGCIIIAKNNEIHKILSQAFKERRVLKEYLALVWGQPPAHWEVDKPIRRHRHQRKKMTVALDGKPARTLFRCLDHASSVSLVHAQPQTGRTHQIRVHLAYSGYPILGDPLYGGKRRKSPVSRLALHAWKIAFPHPRTQKVLQIIAPLPEDMLQWLDFYHLEVHDE